MPRVRAECSALLQWMLRLAIFVLLLSGQKATEPRAKHRYAVDVGGGCSPDHALDSDSLVEIAKWSELCQYPSGTDAGIDFCRNRQQIPERNDGPKPEDDGEDRFPGDYGRNQAHQSE